MDQHGVIATVGTVNVSAKTSAVWDMIFAKSPSCVCVFAINSLWILCVWMMHKQIKYMQISTFYKAKYLN